MSVYRCFACLALTTAACLPSGADDALDDVDRAVRRCAPEPAGLELQFRLMWDLVEVGGVAPGHFVLVNRTAGPLTVVRLLDGSMTGRYPRIRLFFRPEGGTWREVLSIRECGLMNALQDRDFVVVPAGEEYVLEPGIQRLWKPERPGCYELVAEYDTEAPSDFLWFGFPARPTAPLLKRLSELPSGRFRSNPVRVRVVE